jgi:hypothetical protein
VRSKPLAAGLAATVTLAAASCKQKSYATEMVAAPSGPVAVGPPPTDPQQGVDDSAADTPPAGPPALIKPAVARSLLRVIGRNVVPAEPVEIELWITRDGQVSKAWLNRPQLTPASQKAIVDEALAMTFSDPGVRGQRYVVHFAKEEVEKASGVAPPTPPPTSHPRENAPRPEMAPRPPNPSPPPRPEMAPRKPNLN